MAISIGNNIASLKAQASLNKASDALSRVQERLASGLRINRASDDAAGLAIASSLASQAKVYGTAMRNVNDAVSLISIADSALESLSSILTRQIELAEQAANGTFSSAQRRAMDAEAGALSDEYNRIIKTTTFNGIALLAAPKSIAIQAGINGQSSSSLSLSLGNELARTVGDGTFKPYASYVTGLGPLHAAIADFNGDGKADLVAANNGEAFISVLLGNGDGTFQPRTTFACTQQIDVAAADMNSDGKSDLVVASTDGLRVFLGNGNGTFGTAQFYALVNAQSVALGDYDGDGKLDVASVTGGQRTANIYWGNGNGTLTAGAVYTISNDAYYIQSADFNNDGIADFAFEQDFQMQIFLGSGDRNVRQRSSYTNNGWAGIEVKVGDFNRDGMVDIADAGTNGIEIAYGRGDGTFSPVTVVGGRATGTPPSLQAADINGDGYLDLIGQYYGTNQGGVLLSNGDGTYAAEIPYTTSAHRRSVAAGDLNGDGVPDIVVNEAWPGAATTIDVLMSNTTKTTTMARPDLTTRSSAQLSQTALQSQLERVGRERGVVGAFMSRLNVAASHLGVIRDTTLEAAARIQDADIALEAAELARLEIVRNAAVSILAQANQQPALALKLLQQ